MTHPRAFIGRQPILDKSQALVGYELLHRDGESDLYRRGGTALTVGMRVLINALSEIGMEAIVGKQLALIKSEPKLLESEYLDLLDPKLSVLDLIGSLAQYHSHQPRIEALRELGFRFAATIRGANELEALTPGLLSIVKIDIKAIGLQRALEMLPTIGRLDLQVMACKVEELDEFQACLKVGFDLFQGWYFAKAEIIESTVLTPVHTSVLEALRLVQSDADLDKIADVFRTDVALSAKLLRFMNSAGMGLARELTSIRDAVSMIGYKRMSKWLALVLVTANQAKGSTRSVAKTAIVRGRTMELVGASRPGPEADLLFMCGLLSLMDTMLNMPMDKVLETLPFPETLISALRDRSGRAGDLLLMVESLEDPHLFSTESICDSLKIDPHILNDAHLRSIGYAEQFGL
jgi:c-di-GMP phosphodiesterase